jgi:hypothetical protein
VEAVSGAAAELLAVRRVYTRVRISMARGISRSLLRAFGICLTFAGQQIFAGNVNVNIQLISSCGIKGI